MPMVIGAAIVGSTLAGMEVVGGVTIAAVVGYSVTTAATIGISMALNYANTPNAPKNNYQQQISKQSVTPRLRGYGRDRLGGAAFFWSVALNKNYDRGIIHCEGPIDAFEMWILDSTNTGLASGTFGGSNTAAPWGNNIAIESHAGGVAGLSASPILLADFPTDWPASGVLNGLAYTVYRMIQPSSAQVNTKFPNGRAPDLRVQLRMSKVYDPRDLTQSWDNPGTWKWSDNPAVCILDFLTTMKINADVLVPVGFGISKEWIDLDSFIAAANVHDSKGWKLGGVYRYDEEPSSVLARLLATCDGELTFVDGLIGLTGGSWTEPTVTITSDHVLSYQYEYGADRLAAFNRLKITYTSVDHDFQQVEADPWEDLESQALTGEVLTQDLAVPMVQSHTQARQLAKIAFNKGNPTHKFTNITTTLAGLAAWGHRTVRLDLPDLGINDTFQVTRMMLNEDQATLSMDLTSLTAAAYAWAPAESGNPPPVV